MKRTKRSLALFGLPLGLALAFATAPAFGWVMIPGMPGSACVANSTLKYDNKLGAGNGGTGSVTAHCPVVSDTRDLSENLSHALWVNVIDQNPNSGADVKCTVYGTNEYTQLGYTSATQHTSSTSASSQLFEFDAPFGLALNLSCYLPGTYNGKQSRVVNYGFQYTD
jgi:hypothetical protein